MKLIPLLCVLIGAGASHASDVAAPESLLLMPADSTASRKPARDAAPDSAAAPPDSSLAASDSTGEREPPEDAPADRDYEVERERSVAPSEIEMGYSLASQSGGRVSQRRRVQVREEGVEAEVREGRGDGLAGAALGARVPGGWLALGRASPRWGRGMMVGAPVEPWRAHGFAAPDVIARPREGDAVEFRHPGALGIDLVAAHQRHDAFAAAQLGAGAAALEFAMTRALENRNVRALAGVRVKGALAEAEAALDRRGSWRLEAARADPKRALSLALRLGHFDFQGVERPRVAPPGAALAGALRGAPRAALTAQLEGSCWRFPGGQSGHRVALEVTADMAQHEAISMGFEERLGTRRFVALDPAAGALRQGVWAEWRRGSPGLAMNLRHEWWGREGGFKQRVRELASAELEARPRPGMAASVSVWLYRTASADPQYLTESEIDRIVWRVVSGAGHRTRVRASFPAAGGSVRAALTISQSGGSVSPPQWTLDWTRRARTRATAPQTPGGTDDVRAAHESPGN